jgi:hypothetical protein
MRVSGLFVDADLGRLTLDVVFTPFHSSVREIYVVLPKRAFTVLSFRGFPEVQGKIGSADKTLTTFEAAVTNIEKNRAKFPHVDDQELASRKESVLQLKERLAAARNTVSGKKAQGKMDQDRKSVPFPLSFSSASPLNPAVSFKPSDAYGSS